MTPERAIKILKRRTVEGDQFIEIVESLTQQNPDLDLWFETRKLDGLWLVVDGAEHRVKHEYISAFPDMANRLAYVEIPQLCDVVLDYLQNPREKRDWEEIMARALSLIQDQTNRGKSQRWWADELGVPRATLFRDTNTVGKVIKRALNL